MPDITMCGTLCCPMSARCRRHPDSGTRASDWQSWSAFGPPGPDCGHHWPVNERPSATIAAPGTPTTDASAPDRAAVSVTRPIGDLSSGRPPADTGA